MMNEFELEDVNGLEEFKEDTRKFEKIYKVIDKSDPSTFSIYYIFYPNEDNKMFSLKEVPYIGNKIFREYDDGEPIERLSKDYGCLDELHESITFDMTSEDTLRTCKFEDYRTEQQKNKAYLAHIKTLRYAKIYDYING